MNVSDHKGPDALAAYVALQIALTQPVKDARANAGTFSYTYLSLPKLLDHIARPQREAGLAIAQEDVGDAATVAIATTIIHLSGGWLSFGPMVFPAPTDPQKRGAVISYARRYSLLAALGLAAEDDDAASAVMPRRVGEGPDVAPAATGEGAGDGGEPTPLPTPDDIGATQRHYHPGKPHDMIHSPHAPALEICTRNGCTFNRRAA